EHKEDYSPFSVDHFQLVPAPDCNRHGLKKSASISKPKETDHSHRTNDRFNIFWTCPTWLR
ncbi:hedgehog, partial [Biomphalaria glabrata]